MSVSKTLLGLTLLCLTALVIAGCGDGGDGGGCGDANGSNSLCTGIPGYDYFGNDIRRVGGVANWKACCSLCMKENRCKAYTYNTGNKNCWLKHTAANLHTCNGCYTQSVKQVLCSAIAKADYWGGDIKRVDNIRSWARCCLLCGMTDKCKGYTWKPSGNCWLKHTLGNYQACNDCYTQKLYGPKCDAIPGKDYWGGDIKSIADVKSWAQCCDLCNATPNCKGYTWNKVAKRCWLKHTLNTDLRNNPNAYTQKFGEPLHLAT